MTYVADLERKWQLKKEAAKHSRLADVGPGPFVDYSPAMKHRTASMRALAGEICYDRLLCNGAIE